MRRLTPTFPIIFSTWAAIVCSPSLSIRRELPRLTATRNWRDATRLIRLRTEAVLRDIGATQTQWDHDKCGSAPGDPPAIHSFYFFDPNGIRLEITADLDGDEEDLQVIRSCSMDETELRAELETISSDRAWIDEMVAAMARDETGKRDRALPSG